MRCAVLLGLLLAGRLAAVGRVEELLASPLEQIEVTASGLPPEVAAAFADRSVVPHRRTLEEVFLARVREGSR